MIKQIATTLFLSVVLLSCANKRLSQEEKAYFMHLYFGMLDAFQESEDICHVHHVPTEARLIQSYAGMPNMPDEQYMKARVLYFSNSFFYALTGYCASGDWEIIRKVCPKCRIAEANWLESHGKEVPEINDKAVVDNDA